MFADTDNEPVHGRFDVALGQPLPSDRAPRGIEIRLEQSGGLIYFQFVGNDSVAYSRPYSCSEGWYVLQEDQGAKNLPDGVKMEYSEHDIRLAVSADGGLIVHSKTNARFTTLGLAKSDERIDVWYHFPKSSNEK